MPKESVFDFLETMTYFCLSAPINLLLIDKLTKLIARTIETNEINAMKTLILIAFLLPTMLFAQQTYVPDDNFEQALIDLGYDEGPLNDSVPTNNINNIEVLDIAKMEIADLTGIEDFNDLTTLYCYSNNLRRLDVSQNKTLISLYCNRNDLDYLNVNDNAMIEFISCYSNHFRRLDVSHNIELDFLDCSNNQIKSLDLSNNIALEYLNCFANHLSELDLSNNIALTSLDCGQNQLTTLDLSNNIALDVLNCSGNHLSTLDLSNNIALEYLRCYENDLISLDLSYNINLEYLDCSSNYIRDFDISECRKLKVLKCNNILVETLDLRNNINLEILNFHNSYKLKNTLDLRFNPKLKEISFSKTWFEHVHLPSDSLERLYASFCIFESLDLSSMKRLNYLKIWYCEISELNIQNGNNNLISELRIITNPNLECIQVDDPDWSENNSAWTKDDHAIYSEDCSTLSIEEPSFNFAISPNPATDFINIESESLNTEIEIYNMLGISVLRAMANEQIDVSGLPRGIYFIKNADNNSYTKVVLY